MVTKQKLDEVITEVDSYFSEKLKASYDKILSFTSIREFIDSGFRMGELEELGLVFMSYYSPSQSSEYEDIEGNYYNRSGRSLRHPIEYSPYQEGYTPFGDE